MSTTPKKTTITVAQRAWFKEFEDNTGGDALGLQDLEDGLTTFAEAAQHSIACYREETRAMADRLEQALNPLLP